MTITIENYTVNGKHVGKAVYNIPDEINLEDVHWDIIEEMFTLAADE